MLPLVVLLLLPLPLLELRVARAAGRVARPPTQCCRCNHRG